MAETQLQIINKVQRRLRETVTASAATSDYSTLLAEFLNDVIDDLNSVHDWSLLESEESVSLAASTRTYDLTGTTNQSQLLFDQNNRPLAVLFDDGSDDAANVRMNYLPPNDLWMLIQTDRDETEEDPNYFTLRQQNDADNLELEIWPLPEVSRLARLRFWTPQPTLAVDGTADATTIYLPARPLYLGTLMLALNERGEEIGEPGNLAEQRYLSAVADAVYTDTIARGRGNAFEFRRD